MNYSIEKIKNVFAIIAHVESCMCKEGYSKAHIKKFRDEAENTGSKSKIFRSFVA